MQVWMRIRNMRCDRGDQSVLDLVDVGERSLESYRGVAPDALLEDLKRTASALRGARVLHVNAGMVVEDEAAVATDVDGVRVRFCSDQCRALFVTNPGRYAPGRAP